MLKARFFRRTSDGAWLARVDTQPLQNMAEAAAHCAQEYGFSVTVVDQDLVEEDFSRLVRERRVGAVLPPVQPPQPDTADETAYAALTTLEAQVNFLARSLRFKRI